MYQCTRDNRALYMLTKHIITYLVLICCILSVMVLFIYSPSLYCRRGHPCSHPVKSHGQTGKFPAGDMQESWEWIFFPHQEAHTGNTGFDLLQRSHFAAWSSALQHTSWPGNEMQAQTRPGCSTLLNITRKEESLHFQLTLWIYCSCE